MTELRWVLLALGVLTIAAIYFWERGLSQLWNVLKLRLRRAKSAPSVRVEPQVGATDGDAEEDTDQEDDSDVSAALEPAQVESIVTLRFIPTEGPLQADRVILALRAAGLRHGQYGIFHKHASAMSDEPLFSVANLTEPGSFDLTKLTETRIPGMSFFMVLPGSGDPLERFDHMVGTARELARELEAELRDENGSSWSIQRERYVREEIIEYLHQHDKPRLG